MRPGRNVEKHQVGLGFSDFRNSLQAGLAFDDGRNVGITAQQECQIAPGQISGLGITLRQDGGARAWMLRTGDYPLCGRAGDLLRGPGSQAILLACALTMGAQ